MVIKLVHPDHVLIQPLASRGQTHSGIYLALHDSIPKFFGVVVDGGATGLKEGMKVIYHKHAGTEFGSDREVFSIADVYATFEKQKHGAYDIVPLHHMVGAYFSQELKGERAGIIMPDLVKGSTVQAVVAAVGPDVTEVAPGEIVVVPRRQIQVDMKYGNTRYILIDERKVLGTLG